MQFDHTFDHAPFYQVTMSITSIEQNEQHQEQSRQAQYLLEQYLHASGRTEAERFRHRLEQDHAIPVVRSILRRKMNVRLNESGQCDSLRQSRNDMAAEEIFVEVLAQVGARLAELRTEEAASARDSETTAAIQNYRGYVAKATFYAYNRHLRTLYPRRFSLKNQLRYLLTQKRPNGLSLWEGAEGETLCGFTVWREAFPTSTNGRVPPQRLADCATRLRTLGDDKARFLREALPGQAADHVSPGDLLCAIFQWVGGPVELDALVDVCAVLLEIRDDPERSLDEEGAAEGQESAAEREANRQQVVRAQRDGGPVHATVENREFLRFLWEEVRLLSPSQSKALLLNLRDGAGKGIIALLPICGIASIRQIAEAMQMPAEELAEMWKRLPMEDADIAAYMALTRQQIINLRKCARERLARRLRNAE